jgi:cytochrome c
MIAFSGFLLAAESYAQSPSLGKPMNSNDVLAINFTVLPDGTGLPEGAGSAAGGETVYRQHCAACHGVEGNKPLNDRLIGGIGSLTTDRPIKTVGSFWPYATTLFDYTRRAMPYPSPGVLTNDELYAVTAYVLFLNGIVDRAIVLDAETLPGILMPNRDNFVWADSLQIDP